MKKVLALLLAAFLLWTPVHAASSGAGRPGQEQDAGSNRGRLYLILGGTVAGVTGMWVTLYKRGKK